ncbi:Hypothetical protein D9617_3g020590 [Elsinoe fawcettii]|nr:Hypothetical protein D9617_3g020590 [Elsinoe fawcettii]
MPGYTSVHASVNGEAFPYKDFVESYKDESPSGDEIHEDAIPVIQTKQTVPRLQPPSRPPPAPPVQTTTNKSLPPTPIPGYSPPQSTTSATYSQKSTPSGNGTQVFQPPPTTPPPTTSSAYQPLPSRSTRRGKRSPSYLPLDAYPPGVKSPSFNAVYQGQFYGTTPPSSTPSLSPPSSQPSPSQTPRSSPSHSPSASPASTRRRPTRSYPPSAFSPSWSPGYNSFSPVPLSAAPPLSSNPVSTPGRPEWYTQSQTAALFSPAQMAAQERLEAQEAQEGSLSGILAAAAARVVSPASSEGWSARGAILPGGGSGGSSRRGSFSDLTGKKGGEGGEGQEKGAWGVMVGGWGKWWRGKR